MRLPRRRVYPGSVCSRTKALLALLVAILPTLSLPALSLRAQDAAGRSKLGGSGSGTTPRAPAGTATRPAAGTSSRPAAGTSPRPAAGAAATTGKERPEGQSLQVEPLSPELMQLLKDWETSSSKITAMYGDHERFVYNHTFAIEKRGKGRLYYEAPDKGRYEVEPAHIAKGEVSKKVDKSGTSYTLKPHEAELWICTGSEIVKVNSERKEFERAVIPPEDRGQNIVNGPLPFLFGMKAEQARRRYFLKIVKIDDNLDEVWVNAQPREARDAGLWSSATIILNRKTFLPRAVLLEDPTGKETTVHTLKLQPKKGFDGIAALINGNPFQFNPKGYKQIIYDGEGSDLPRQGTAPRQGVPGDTSQKPQSPTANAPGDGRKQTAVPGSGTSPAGAKVGAVPAAKGPVRTAGTGTRAPN
jgi:TIGR03009 family protein